jgi:hypothetical protein
VLDGRQPGEKRVGLIIRHASLCQDAYTSFCALSLLAVGLAPDPIQGHFPTPSEAFQSTEAWLLTTCDNDFDTVSILMHSRVRHLRVCDVILIPSPFLCIGGSGKQNGRIFQQEINGVVRVFELIIEDMRACKNTQVPLITNHTPHQKMVTTTGRITKYHHQTNSMKESKKGQTKLVNYWT